jgi:hypothetical protein
MTTGTSVGSYVPAAIPACRSSQKASSEPNHNSIGDFGALACSSFATRARRLRTATWSAPPEPRSERRTGAQEAVEGQGEVGPPERRIVEVSAGEAVVHLAVRLDITGTAGVEG